MPRTSRRSLTIVKTTLPEERGAGRSIRVQVRWIIGIGVIFSPTLALFLAFYRETIPSRDKPSAKKGVMDLTGWDFHTQGFVQLDGE